MGLSDAEFDRRRDQKRLDDIEEMREFLEERKVLDHSRTIAAFTIEECGQCGPVVRCPRCGMTACTGGYGEEPDGRKCPVCPAAYALQFALWDAIQAEKVVMEQREMAKKGIV